MTIATAGDLIILALKSAGINGVGQTPSADDANDSLAFLNMLLAQWQRKRWLVWSLVDTAFVSTGAAVYTVGPAGNFAIARPDVIEAAYARLTTGPTPLDISLGVIPSGEEYAAISLKTMPSVPRAVYYESAYPVGKLHVWPVAPATAYELHIVTKITLPTPLALTTALALPPEYIEALLWSLVVRLAPAYGLDPRPVHIAAMQASLNTLRQANTQIETLSMPAGLVGRRFGSVDAAASPAFQSGQWQ